MVDSPKASFFRRNFGWIILSVSLLLQFLSFQQMVRRDIQGIYAFSFDQAVYLTHAYDTFEASRTTGLFAGLKQSLLSAGKPNGVLLQYEAAMAYLFFGAGRMTSLLIPFFHFAALQIVLFATFRRLTARFEISLIAVGLLLLTTSRYYSAGGLNDFRLDFAAACLYGICLCLLLASNLFLERKASAYLIVPLALLFGTRFVSLSYSIMALGLVSAYALFANDRRPGKMTISWRPVFTAATVTAISVLLVSPLIWANFRDLFNYYFIAHLLTNEGNVRAAELGISGLWDQLFFYPKSVIFDHLGRPFVLSVLGLLLLGILFRIYKPGSARQGGEGRPASLPFRLFIGATIWTATPLAIYSLDKIKSPIVASVVIGPVVVLTVLVYSAMRGTLTHADTYLATAVLAAGTLFSVSKSAERVPRLEAAKSMKDLYAAYDDIANTMMTRGMKSARVATDRLVEYFSGTLLKVMIFERTGEFLDTREVTAGGVNAISKEAALQAIDQADFAVLTLDDPINSRPTLYPFDQAMFDYRDDLLSHARATKVGLRKVQVGEHLFQIFAKPRLELLGVSGGWVPSVGFRIKTEPLILSRLKHLLLSGPTMLSSQLRDGLKCEASIVSPNDGTRKSLPVRSYLGRDEYAIAVDTSTAHYSMSEPVEIEFEFSTYFIPVERGINEDTRKLVVSSPANATLVKDSAAYPRALAQTTPTTQTR